MRLETKVHLKKSQYLFDFLEKEVDLIHFFFAENSPSPQNLKHMKKNFTKYQRSSVWQSFPIMQT